MKKEILVLDANKTQFKNICNVLEAHNYKAASVNSLTDLNGYIEGSDSRTLILNLDNISVTNKILKQLKAKNPLFNIIAVSERRFHPELGDALRECISICLATPIDEDELMYWLKTVCDNDKPKG
jgi:DNA-binding NtrC family response regulator